jgi:hypothetical protein
MAQVKEVRIVGRQYKKLAELIAWCRKNNGTMLVPTQAAKDMIQARAPDIEIRVVKRRRA